MIQLTCLGAHVLEMFLDASVMEKRQSCQNNMQAAKQFVIKKIQVNTLTGWQSG